LVNKVKEKVKKKSVDKSCRSYYLVVWIDSRGPATFPLAWSDAFCFAGFAFKGKSKSCGEFLYKIASQTAGLPQEKRKSLRASVRNNPIEWIANLGQGKKKTSRIDWS
jgi:hypothetical protein